MADTKSTAPTANMQNLMTQLGAASPNTIIIGSNPYSGSSAAPRQAPAKR